MAKLYRQKRVSTAYDCRISGDVRKRSNYEMGHVYYQVDIPLPMDAPLHMQQGWTKAAREQDLVWVADFRRLYRLGLVSPLPRYRYMVAGIRPFIFTDRAVHPLKRGQKGRIPHVIREKQARIDAKYRKLAFG